MGPTFVANSNSQFYLYFFLSFYYLFIYLFLAKACSIVTMSLLHADY